MTEIYCLFIHQCNLLRTKRTFLGITQGTLMAPKPSLWLLETSWPDLLNPPQLSLLSRSLLCISKSPLSPL